MLLHRTRKWCVTRKVATYLLSGLLHGSVNGCLFLARLKYEKCRQLCVQYFFLHHIDEYRYDEHSHKKYRTRDWSSDTENSVLVTWC